MHDTIVTPIRLSLLRVTFLITIFNIFLAKRCLLKRNIALKQTEVLFE